MADELRAEPILPAGYVDDGVLPVVAGACAELASPGVVICVAGALGVAAALSLSGAGRRFLSSPSPAVS